MQYRIMQQSYIGNRLVQAGTVLDVPPAGYDQAGNPIHHVPGPHWLPVDDDAKAAYEKAGHKAPQPAEGAVMRDGVPGLEPDDRPEVQPDAATHEVGAPVDTGTATERDNMNRPILPRRPDESREDYEGRRDRHWDEHRNAAVAGAGTAPPVGAVPATHGDVAEAGRTVAPPESAEENGGETQPIDEPEPSPAEGSRASMSGQPAPEPEPQPSPDNAWREGDRGRTVFGGQPTDAPQPISEAELSGTGGKP